MVAALSNAPVRDAAMCLSEGASPSDPVINNTQQ
jgi:hypothetical protein